MQIIKAVIIAFSMYSKIPMPQFKWEERDMRYMLCFFPWVGVVIGACIYLWNLLCVRIEVGNLCRTLISAAIPLLITGGFHVDGFMDTMDAFHSYQPRERKLEILKDSHIGAFAVIMLACYGLLYVGALSEVSNPELLKILCAGFALSRCLSGIGVVTLPSAKTDGMLYTFASGAHKRTVKGALYLQSILCACFMVWQSPLAGIATVVAALASFWYYSYRSKKELGGITGDTAGYFVLLCEGMMVLVTAVWNVCVR
ncbi:MAG: adenosylcobinamide-GDP ribazoletransferase [Agathobacter sp.]|nr:adenosylcobinamide-GDP ribazoletransferase [Agathobacter sp.]